MQFKPHPMQCNTHIPNPIPQPRQTQFKNNTSENSPLLSFLLVLFFFPITGNLHARSVVPPSARRSSNGRDSMLRPLVSVIGSSYIPDVGLERIAPAADARFCKVADGVLCLWEGWFLVLSVIYGKMSWKRRKMSVYLSRQPSWPTHTPRSRPSPKRVRPRPCTTHTTPSSPTGVPSAPLQCRNARSEPDPLDSSICHAHTHHLNDNWHSHAPDQRSA